MSFPEPLKNSSAINSTPKSRSGSVNKSTTDTDSDEKDDSLCKKCSLEISGTYNIYNGNKYHTDCFVCCQCNKAIIESTFYNRDEKPLCRVCFNFNLVANASTCHKCSQVILDTLVTFKDFNFHDYCLVCTNCDKSLIGQSIYSDLKKSPYCIECFTIKEAKFCSTCTKPIVPNQTSFLFNGKNFHKECFVCSRCERQINSDETFFKNKENNSLFVCGDCFKK